MTPKSSPKTPIDSECLPFFIPLPHPSSKGHQHHPHKQGLYSTQLRFSHFSIHTVIYLPSILFNPHSFISTKEKSFQFRYSYRNFISIARGGDTRNWAHWAWFCLFSIGNFCSRWVLGILVWRPISDLYVPRARHYTSYEFQSKAHV